MSAVPVELLQCFATKFGGSPRVFSAPGRVNLIGEHTDYNDGFVFPIAIEQRTYVAARAREDELVVVHSLAKHEEFRFDLTKPGGGHRDSWVDYVEGTAQSLRSRGHRLRGADMAIWSDVPVGAGLSSSAALEVAVGLALVSLADKSPTDPVELALAGQAAEHEYVGTLCGIMDQFAAALSRADSALLIDCRSLAARPVALELGSATLLVCDTRVKHRLADSAYNQRRRECQEGVALVKRLFPEVRSLRDVALNQLSQAALPEPLLRRCRHVVSENERTLRAADALAEGRIADMGALMSQSHESLRDDYEVSCAELDEAVAAARAQPGVYGARMTGGGFGGCTITLAEREAVPRVREAIERVFAQRFDKAPAFFTSRASGGAREDAVTGTPSS